ncbi:hypothetical protein EDD16DRAFT_1520640 [Pisolithus croceorrhizus]|nr:hypothetical protein EDD16DRAFT_1520640 [Pisolithus croceorrhizus]
MWNGVPVCTKKQSVKEMHDKYGAAQAALTEEADQNKKKGSGNTKNTRQPRRKDRECGQCQAVEEERLRAEERAQAAEEEKQREHEQCQAAEEANAKLLQELEALRARASTLFLQILSGYEPHLVAESGDMKWAAQLCQHSNWMEGIGRSTRQAYLKLQPQKAGWVFSQARKQTMKLRTSHEMYNYLATKFQDPTPISVPTEKPIEASSDNNKILTSCQWSHQVRRELTKARSNYEAEAADGVAQQVLSRSIEVEENLPELHKQLSSRARKPPKSEHIEVLDGIVEKLGKVESIDRKACEDLPMKLCNRSTKNDLPDAQELPLKGEQAMCMSGSPRNSNSIEDEQPRLVNVNFYCYRHSTDADTLNANSGTTNSQSCYPKKPQLTIYNPGGTLQWLMASSQEAEKGGAGRLYEQLCWEYKQQQEKPMRAHEYLEGAGNSQAPKAIPMRLSSRDVKEDEIYSKLETLGIGTPTNLTIEYRTLKECPEGIRSQHSVDMNPPSQTRGPGGQVEVNEMFGDVEDEWKHQNDQEQVGMDGKWCRMDGATSSTHHDSKRVKTRLLTGDEGSGQHKWQKHKPIDVPEPPTPLGIHLGQPTKPVNEPWRHGKLKSRSRSVRHSRGTRKDLPCYQIESRMKGAVPSREKPCRRPREAVYKNPGHETRRWGVQSQLKVTVHAEATHKPQAQCDLPNWATMLMCHTKSRIPRLATKQNHYRTE